MAQPATAFQSSGSARQARRRIRWFLLTALLVPGLGCFYPPYPVRTPLDKWETRRFGHLGVQVELPKQPLAWRARYEEEQVHEPGHEWVYIRMHRIDGYRHADRHRLWVEIILWEREEFTGRGTNPFLPELYGDGLGFDEEKYFGPIQEGFGGRDREGALIRSYHLQKGFRLGPDEIIGVGGWIQVTAATKTDEFEADKAAIRRIINSLRALE